MLGKFLAKASVFSRENLVLLEISRSKQYKRMVEKIEEALLKQTSELLRSSEIKDNVGTEEKPEEVIWGDTDKKRVKDSVQKNIKPLTDYLEEKEIVDFFVYCANKGGQAFLDKVGVDAEFDILGESDATKVRKRINTEKSEMYTRADRLIVQLDTTSQNQIADSINRGRENGQAYNDIANDIRGKVPETYNNRANVIARTEMTELVNDTEMRAARMNHAETKIWNAAGPSICEICEENDGVAIPLNNVFPSGHIRPPAHPNCKCLLDYKMPPISLTSNIEEVGGSWTGGERVHNLDTVNADLDRVYHRATAAKSEVDKLADDTASKIKNAFVVKTKLKGRARALEKTLTEGSGNAFSITDVARNTVVVKNSKDAYKVVESLQGLPAVVKLKSGARATSLGYKGGMIKYKAATGNIAEIQVITQKMIYAKESGAKKILGTKIFNQIKNQTGLKHGLGHKYYEEWRILFAQGKTEAAAAIAKKSKKYYSNFI